MRFRCLILGALVGLAQTLLNHAYAGGRCNCRERAPSLGYGVAMAPTSPGLSPDQRRDAQPPGNTRRVAIAISGMK
jgi:hypothetical protein